MSSGACIQSASFSGLAMRLSGQRSLGVRCSQTPTDKARRMSASVPALRNGTTRTVFALLGFLVVI